MWEFNEENQPSDVKAFDEAPPQLNRPDLHPDRGIYRYPSDGLGPIPCPDGYGQWQQLSYWPLQSHWPSAHKHFQQMPHVPCGPHANARQLSDNALEEQLERMSPIPEYHSTEDFQQPSESDLYHTNFSTLDPNTIVVSSFSSEVMPRPPPSDDPIDPVNSQGHMNDAFTLKELKSADEVSTEMIAFKDGPDYQRQTKKPHAESLPVNPKNGANRSVKKSPTVEVEDCKMALYKKLNALRQKEEAEGKLSKPKVVNKKSGQVTKLKAVFDTKNQSSEVLKHNLFRDKQISNIKDKPGHSQSATTQKTMIIKPSNKKFNSVSSCKGENMETTAESQMNNAETSKYSKSAKDGESPTGVQISANVSAKLTKKVLPPLVSPRGISALHKSTGIKKPAEEAKSQATSPNIPTKLTNNGSHERKVSHGISPRISKSTGIKSSKSLEKPTRLQISPQITAKLQVSPKISAKLSNKGLPPLSLHSVISPTTKSQKINSATFVTPKESNRRIYKRSSYGSPGQNAEGNKEITSKTSGKQGNVKSQPTKCEIGVQTMPEKSSVIDQDSSRASNGGASHGQNATAEREDLERLSIHNLMTESSGELCPKDLEVSNPISRSDKFCNFLKPTESFMKMKNACTHNPEWLLEELLSSANQDFNITYSVDSHKSLILHLVKCSRCTRDCGKVFGQCQEIGMDEVVTSTSNETCEELSESQPPSRQVFGQRPETGVNDAAVSSTSNETCKEFLERRPPSGEVFRQSQEMGIDDAGVASISYEKCRELSDSQLSAASGKVFGQCPEMGVNDASVSTSHEKCKELSDSQLSRSECVFGQSSEMGINDTGVSSYEKSAELSDSQMQRDHEAYQFAEAEKQILHAIRQHLIFLLNQSFPGVTLCNVVEFETAATGEDSVVQAEEEETVEADPNGTIEVALNLVCSMVVLMPFTSPNDDDTESYGTCPLCWQTVTKTKLKSHMRKHLKADYHDHACQVCGKAFKELDTLIAHLLCHKTSKDFTCESCTGSYSNVEYLKLHRRSCPML